MSECPDDPEETVPEAVPLTRIVASAGKVDSRGARCYEILILASCVAPGVRPFMGHASKPSGLALIGCFCSGKIRGTRASHGAFSRVAVREKSEHGLLRSARLRVQYKIE